VSEHRQTGWRKITTFLVLTFVLSFPFWLSWIGVIAEPFGRLATAAALMWCPGLAGIITKLLFRESIADLGWRWGKTRYQLTSYLLPIFYSLAVYVPVWVLGLGRFYNREFVETLEIPFGVEVSSPALLIVIFVLISATVGFLMSCALALGEEIGWRGFLVPELNKLVGFTATSVISGLAWAVWHYPVLIFGDYNAGTPTWYGLTCFTVMVVCLSFAFAWLRLRSGNLWTATVLHSSHNVFIQGVLDPLTAGVAITPFVIGEFGAGLAVVTVIIAIVCWRMKPVVVSASE